MSKPVKDVTDFEIDGMLSKLFAENKRLRHSAVASLFFGIITHMYVYVSDIYGFDNIAINTYFKLDASATRYLVNLGYLLTGLKMQPWLCGILAELFMIFSVYMMVCIFDIKSTFGVWLIAGLCQTDITVIAAHLYGAGVLCHSIALFFSLGSVYAVRKRFTWKTVMISVTGLLLTASTYGSYSTVTVTVMLFILVMNIYEGANPKQTIKHGIGYLGIICAGLGSWYGILRILLWTSSQKLNDYGSESAISNINTMRKMDTMSLVLRTYKECIDYYTKFKFTSHILFYAILIATITIIANMLRKHEAKNRITNWIIVLVIIILLPIAMDFTKIAANGTTHYLMWFAYVIPYIFAVKVLEQFIQEYTVEGKAKFKRMLACFEIALIMVYIYFGVVLANTAYIRMHNYFLETYSICTRLEERIETTEGYTGEETVVIVGRVKENAYLNKTGIKPIPMLDGMFNAEDDRCNGIRNFNLPYIMSNIMGFSPDCKVYYNIDELSSAKILSDAGISEIKAMPDFPRKDSTKKIGNLIVIRMSDPECN